MCLDPLSELKIHSAPPELQACMERMYTGPKHGSVREKEEGNDSCVSACSAHLPLVAVPNSLTALPIWVILHFV